MSTLEHCLAAAFARGGAVSELPLLLVIEDEYLLLADIEKVLTDAGFTTDIVSAQLVTAISNLLNAGTPSTK
jgi:hypothetical protein